MNSPVEQRLVLTVALQQLGALAKRVLQKWGDEALVELAAPHTCSSNGPDCANSNPEPADEIENAKAVVEAVIEAGGCDFVRNKGTPQFLERQKEVREQRVSQVCTDFAPFDNGSKLVAILRLYGQPFQDRRITTDSESWDESFLFDSLSKNQHIAQFVADHTLVARGTTRIKELFKQVKDEIRNKCMAHFSRTETPLPDGEFYAALSTMDKAASLLAPNGSVSDAYAKLNAADALGHKLATFKIARDELSWEERQHLGAGSFGKVFSGTFKGRAAAIKVVRHHEKLNTKQRKKLYDEMKIGVVMQHINLVR